MSVVDTQSAAASKGLTAACSSSFVPRLPSRHVDSLPVATLGDATVDGLRRLLAAAGAKPGGPRHIVVTDLREELVL